MNAPFVASIILGGFLVPFAIALAATLVLRFHGRPH